MKHALQLHVEEMVVVRYLHLSVLISLLLYDQVVHSDDVLHPVQWTLHSDPPTNTHY